ncbi:MAG: 16S rRNA (adenine(1518)-N(6)/adenine(1519)-N(6))-dimethyltransferase RsmA [Ruminococcaceae bacterium]|nr:16S rRNA (adenine(1518)-N(6)/adenine(1519)-N(6))-dimethyltransferase RsmA [Oscillospiraceae bacterium]
MYKLTDPSEIRRLMTKYGKNFKKSLGQNFLTDEEVLDDIIRCSEIKKGDLVLEIGPGIGVLTCKLAGTGAEVTAVEIDDTLLPILAETLADFDNVNVINADFMKLTLNDIFKGKASENRKIKVAANLPYYITTPILMRLLESRSVISSITVMVQKEVAERLTAQSGNADCGAISLAVQYRAKAEIVRVVPSKSFMPAPKVDSAVVKLTVLDEPAVKVSDEKLFFRLIKGGFAVRRKTFQNSLLVGAGIPKEKTLEALTALGLSPTVRGEALSLKDYADLTDYFKKIL